MDIHKDLDAITEVAKHYAKEHKCNYNVIIHNPVDGEFDKDVSTYEYVTDSYFEKERNCVIVHTTDDIFGDKKANYDDPFDTSPRFIIQDTYKDIREMTEVFGHLANKTHTEPYVREERKIGRNEWCPCGSGKKYKKCCQ